MYHYPFHLRDYLCKTRHLTVMEDLAYRRLLDAYYTREGALPASADDCARLICLSEFKVEVCAVLGEFFELTDDGYTNSRCEDELVQYRSRLSKASASASSRWEKKKKAKKPKEEAEGFDEFWAIYPRKQGKASAEKTWQKLSPPATLRQTILSKVKARSLTHEWTKDNGQFVPLASSYLNQKRWEDEAAPDFWSSKGAQL